MWKSTEEKYGKDIVEESTVSQQQTGEIYQPDLGTACMRPGYQTWEGNSSETEQKCMNAGLEISMKQVGMQIKCIGGQYRACE